jgi:hypothetical protein
MRWKVEVRVLLLFVFSLVVLGGALLLVWSGPHNHPYGTTRSAGRP